MTKITPFKTSDLQKIAHLQPVGWPDIIPEFQFYLAKHFCYPIKASISEQLIGLGALIFFQNSAWLSHIIVDRHHQKKGIGFLIVDHLLRLLDKKSIESCSLVATAAGFRLYEKAGFRVVGEYTYLERIKPSIAYPADSLIRHITPELYTEVLKLDQSISGENRYHLLAQHLDTGLVIGKSSPQGYYLPNLGEGLIGALTKTAGITLLNYKSQHAEKLVLPSQNIAAIDFLLANGFQKTDKSGIRMVYGTEIKWQGDKVYSRIAGNYG